MSGDGVCGWWLGGGEFGGDAGKIDECIDCVDCNLPICVSKLGGEGGGRMNDCDGLFRTLQSLDAAISTPIESLG